MNKSVIATVGNKANYPSFNNSVLSIRIADEINLDKEGTICRDFRNPRKLSFCCKKS